MNKKILITGFMITVLAVSASCAYALSVYVRDGDIYATDDSGDEQRLTFLGNNSDPRLAPDAKKIVFVRYKKEDISSGKNNLPAAGKGPFPADHDAIWSMDADGENKRIIVKNYYSGVEDASRYLCSFERLVFSPDGKYIYFLAKPKHDQARAIFCRAGADGADIKRFSDFNEFDGVVGGGLEDKYYGHIVVYQRKHSAEESGAGWLVVLIDPDGNKVEEFGMSSLDKFWQEHRKAS